MCFGKQILNISVTLDFDDWMVGACFAALRREQEGGGFAREGGGVSISPGHAAAGLVLAS